MTQIMVHDYSECTREEVKVGDFSKEKKYQMDAIAAIKLIGKIVYEEVPHAYAFYTLDDEYLLDLS